jgi:hypothetical protein
MFHAHGGKCRKNPSTHTSRRHTLLIALARVIGSLVFLFYCPVTPLARSQPVETPTQSRIQLGLGVVPGFGGQLGYVSPSALFTTEGMLYVNASPQFAGGQGSVQVSLGIGGAFRPLGLTRMMGNTGYTGYDIDLGLRFGPSLEFFTYEETRVEKNQRFSLFLDPYVRVTSDIRPGRRFFVEAGIQRPLFRGGLWLSL